MKEWCQNDFEQMVRDSPDELTALVHGVALKPALASFAAETLGSIMATDEARDALLACLKHESPIVREGAVLGLANWAGDRDTAVLDALKRVLRNDPSPGVRDAVGDILG